MQTAFCLQMQRPQEEGAPQDGEEKQKNEPGGLTMARRITIDRAVEILREEYEKACKNSVVRNPVAYALYQTWKRYDNG